MHYIQKHILDALRAEPELHYAELNTFDIESGHFSYHLRELIKDGLVAQQQRGVYSLTIEGRHMVDRLSSKQGAPHAMPKVITYTLLHHKDTLYLQRKLKEPYRGLLNMIGGKLHEGETPSAAAIREVQEKTGLTIPVPLLQGVFTIQISENGQPLSHVVAYVFRAERNDSLALPVDLATIPRKEIANTSDLAPDFIPILTALETSKSVVITDLEVEF